MLQAPGHHQVSLGDCSSGVVDSCSPGISWQEGGGGARFTFPTKLWRTSAASSCCSTVIPHRRSLGTCVPYHNWAVKASSIHCGTCAGLWGLTPSLSLWAPTPLLDPGTLSPIEELLDKKPGMARGIFRAGDSMEPKYHTLLYIRCTS